MQAVQLVRVAPRWALGFGLMLMGVGCPGTDDMPPPEEPLPVPLAVVDRWARVTDPAHDAFGFERPPELPCDEAMGLIIEDFGPDLAFEIKTDLCNYATVAQPALEPLAPGDTVSVRIWHYELTSPSPSEGWIGFAIDGEVEWHTTVAIPAAADLLQAEIPIDRPIPAGAELQVHVHNHGVNSWDILDVMLTPAAEAAR